MSILPLITGIIDKVKGGHRIKALSDITGYIYGLVLVYVLTLNLWLGLAGAVLWWLGEKPGWGRPIGFLIDRTPRDPDDYERYERWLVKAGVSDTWLMKTVSGAVFSLAVRGLMWALPVSLLAWWNPAVLWLLFTAVTLPTAFYVASELPSIVKRKWSWGHFINGFLLGLVCLVAQSSV